MFRETDSAKPTHGFRVGRTLAFWGLAATLVCFLFASSAPSPLYVVYQDEWGFSASTLTSVFAVYALFLLATLLVAGSVSDRVGRRPALLVALAIEIVGMLVFSDAQSVAWLFAARILQGIGTGIAMGTISAALLDLQPEDDPRLGALLGVIAPLVGLALGALSAGVLVEYGPEPTRLVYWLLLGLFALAVLFALTIPETVRTDGEWLGSLRPSVAVPDAIRPAFVAAIPCMAATWALGGLVLSLGPSLTAGVLGESSHVTGGLPIFILAGVSAVTSVQVRDAHARSTARGGLVALIAGVAIVLVALGAGSIVLFMAGAAIAGLGFGPAFAGAFRALSTQAPLDQRAALVSAILAASYLSFSLPAVAAGAAVSSIGLHEVANVYGAVLIGLAALALLLSSRLQDPQGSETQRARVAEPCFEC